MPEPTQPYCLACLKTRVAKLPRYVLLAGHVPRILPDTRCYGCGEIATIAFVVLHERCFDDTTEV